MLDSVNGLPAASSILKVHGGEELTDLLTPTLYNLHAAGRREASTFAAALSGGSQPSQICSHPRAESAHLDLGGRLPAGVVEPREMAGPALSQCKQQQGDLTQSARRSALSSHAPILL